MDSDLEFESDLEEKKPGTHVHSPINLASDDSKDDDDGVPLVKKQKYADTGDDEQEMLYDESSTSASPGVLNTVSVETCAHDLPSVIHVLAMNLSKEEFRIYVRRNHVVEDALKAVSRKCFSCRFSLKVLCKMN